MRKYVSTQVWQDLTDMHLYHEGESFPFDGRDVGEERMNALETGRNRAGLRLIRAVEVQDDKTPVRTEEEPKKAENGPETVTAEDTPKAEKPRRTRTKK